jgi:4-amino-4-deoxy-L-arabinose transferase-like glycosyltransferase
LTRRHFGRASASVAALLLGCSPIFIAYSSLVLSDIAALCVCLLAAWMVSHASRAELAYAKVSASRQKPAISGPINWMLFAAMAGFAMMIRPTNAAIIAGLAVALALVRPKFGLVDLTLGNIAAGIAGCAILFATPVLWQMHENSVHLGSAWASGYAFWVPEVYGSFAKTFNARFLFGETLPRNPHGNLPVYFLALAGLDRLMSDAAAPPFYLYPFSAAVFAAVGLKRAVRLDEATQRVIYLGLGFLAALLSIYLFYHFTDIVFLLPGIFVVFALAGFGTMEANRILRREWSKTRPSGRGYVLILVIALLDLGLIGSITSELIHRLSLRPPASNVVPALQAIDRQIEPDAVVVSNVSLQFLELYLQPLTRKFEGLHSFDPGEDYTDYHLGRLYAKRAAGWQGPVPPVLFESGGIDRASTTELITTSAKRQVYLLLAAPQSEEYGHILSSELKELSEKFEIEPVANAEPIELYRLKPH